MTRAERLLLWVAALAPLLVALAPRDLWAPDEPRYAQVARETLRDDRWVVPHLAQDPYPEKPPLFFWAVAAISAPFGDVTALGARVAGALAALGSVLLVARLARRWFGDPSAGVTAALLFASTWFVLWNGSRAGLDLPLTFLVLAAVERGSAWAHGGGTPAALVAGLAWAGAVLVKGPMGLLIPPIVLAGGMLASGTRPRAADPGWWLMPLVLAAVGAAWLLPALAQGGDAYRARLLGQIEGRVSGEEGGHVRPFGYYAERVLLLALPWTVHLAAGGAAVLRPRRGAPEHRFGLGACAAGFLGVLLLLTLFATKREVYAIPSLAFASIAGAHALHRSLFPRLLGAGTALAVGVLAAGVVAALGLLLPVDLPKEALRRGKALLEDHPSAPWIVASLIGALVVAGFAGVRAILARSRPVLAARVVALGVVAAAVLATHAVFPAVDPTLSWARAGRAAGLAAAGGPIDCFGIGQRGLVLWSLDRRTTRDLDDAQLAAALDPDGPGGAVLAESRAWEAALARARSADAPGARHLLAAREAWRDRVGRRTVLVLVPGPD